MFGKALLMGGMLAVSAGLAADEAVKLENPGFESGITGWRLHGSQPKDAAARNQVLTIVPGEKSGTKALKLQDIWSDCNPYAMQHVVTRMPGEDMVLEMRFRAFAKAGDKLYTISSKGNAYILKDGRILGSFAVAPMASDNIWQPAIAGNELGVVAASGNSVVVVPAGK